MYIYGLAQEYHVFGLLSGRISEMACTTEQLKNRPVYDRPNRGYGDYGHYSISNNSISNVGNSNSNSSR